MFDRTTKIKRKFSQTILDKSSILMTAAATLSVSGTVLVLAGGIWDALSHIFNSPESFWTVQHMIVYTGVGISTIAVFAAYVVFRHLIPAKSTFGVKLLAAGVGLQIISGLGDSISHSIFGIDGLLSVPHQSLELGLVLAALGAFLILKNTSNKNAEKILPVSIIAFIITTSWLGFNLMLLAGGSVICILVYAAFSSGCAVL